jgi:hypothetical protein
MIYTYFDALLAPMMTDEIEARAMTDVQSMGYADTVDTTYLFQQLVIYRAYQILATECATDRDDVFMQKVSAYRKEYDAVAKQYASMVTKTSTTNTGASAKSIAWGRG